MSLKDCSAYNVQFIEGKPVFIDTLSFDRYTEGEPWVAYRQFCQHFLAPLALMKYRDVRLHMLLRTCIDGIPLDMAKRLLPLRAAFSLSLLIHLILHARSGRKKISTSAGKPVNRRFSKQASYGLIDSLESAVRKLNPVRKTSAWNTYYETCSYSSSALEHKARRVLEHVQRIHPDTLWDFGANTAYFSKLVAPHCRQVISFDFDPLCIETIWSEGNCTSLKNILPLVMDLANPSPSIGWHNRERKSLVERGPAAMALCLALIHHLAIANNVPLDMVARFFADVCIRLVIEFVPKEDPQIQEMLAVRKDIFGHYTVEAFEKTFSEYFVIEKKSPVADTGRSIYLMKNRQLPSSTSDLSKQQRCRIS